MHLKYAEMLTWDQALFSFRVNNIPAGKAKRKESLIQTFYETSAAHFFDWLTFAESANQNFFRFLLLLLDVGKMQIRWLLKKAFIFFQNKNKAVSTAHFTSCENEGDLEGFFCCV